MNGANNWEWAEYTQHIKHAKYLFCLFMHTLFFRFLRSILLLVNTWPFNYVLTHTVWYQVFPCFIGLYWEVTWQQDLFYTIQGVWQLATCFVWKGSHSYIKISVIPYLHICASGAANSEANDEHSNHIFASPFVALALELVSQHESKSTNGENSSFALTCTNTWMFVRMWKQFIRTDTEAYKCLCK